jgi:hypothetical protein
MTEEVYDNESLWRLYSPKPNPWFSSEIIYEGLGVATFEKPTGTIEGKTRITVDETGILNIVMEFEKLNTEAVIHGTLGFIKFHKFLQADLSEGNIVGIGTDNINPCSSLTVQTETGTFTAGGKIFYSRGLGLSSKLNFMVSEGVYEEKTTENPKYWVLPLTNFISSFHLLYYPSLTQHPLRLFSTPTVPEMADEKQRQMALFAANRANTLIGFYFGESVGYIQPLLDYNEKEEKLKSGQSKKCITALMISEVTSKLDEVWFPFDYTNLISFIRGTNVGAAWIEFRDDTGKLVSRKHIPQFETNYRKEYAIIDEAIHTGLGQLISLASNSPEFGQSYFRVLIAHLVRLQPYSRHIEDQMDLLCRTFDTLCEKFGYSVQNLGKQLSEDYQTKIDNILAHARNEVQKLSKNANFDIKPVLQQIESKISNAKNTERAFGLAVIDLLKKYELPDIKIMDKYYALHPNVQGQSWVQTLTKYRGAAIHTGYFAHEKYDIDNVLILEDHLHDILVRIALKVLDYQGTYQPRVIHHLVDEKTIYWIDEDTPATKLGYKSPII